MTKPIAVIIEDDPDQGLIFSITLQSVGFETKLIQDGGTAIEQLATVNPTIIMLDLHLPQVSGESILRLIQDDERYAETRILIASANDRLAERLRPDVDLVLLKPISPNQLRNLAMRFYPKSDTTYN